jgi:hypothetical protein
MEMRVVDSHSHQSEVQLPGAIQAPLQHNAGAYAKTSTSGQEIKTVSFCDKTGFKYDPICLPGKKKHN